MAHHAPHPMCHDAQVSLTHPAVNACLAVAMGSGRGDKGRLIRLELIQACLDASADLTTFQFALRLVVLPGQVFMEFDEINAPHPLELIVYLVAEHPKKPGPGLFDGGRIPAGHEKDFLDQVIGEGSIAGFPTGIAP